MNTRRRRQRFQASDEQLTYADAVLAGAEARELLQREGMMPEPMTVGQFAQHIGQQFEIWGRAIREAGIPPEYSAPRQ